MIHPDTIKEDIEDFLNGDDLRAGVLNSFLSHINKFINEKENKSPDIAIIGGLLRDIAYTGISSFNSDIDLIIDCGKSTLEIFAKQFGISKNKFGGYKYVAKDDNGNSLKIDFWCLYETWTYLNAGVTIESIYDCINGVFFSCDQIAYIINRQQLIMSDDYMQNMKSRKLGIIVEKNPLPHKIAMKAGRHINKYGLIPDSDMRRFMEHLVTL